MTERGGVTMSADLQQRHVQLYGALPAHIEAALRASIRLHGVLIPVAVDQNGRILDGHHRQRIAEEEGVEYETTTIRVASDEHAAEIARTLNADRRQLDEDERKKMVSELRADGHSVRAIAGALGVSKTTVHNDLGELSSGGQLNAPERVTGTDGKSRPATNRPAKNKEGKPPKEKKPKVIVAGAKVEAEYNALKKSYEETIEKNAELADVARELNDKLQAYETTEPDEQQKLIAELQLKLRRKEAEIDRLRVQIRDANNKNNELIRTVKRLQKNAR